MDVLCVLVSWSVLRVLCVLKSCLLQGSIEREELRFTRIILLAGYQDVDDHSLFRFIPTCTPFPTIETLSEGQIRWSHLRHPPH